MKKYEKLMLTKSESFLLAEIMPDETLKEIVILHYCDGLPLAQVGEKIGYCVRQVERFNQEIKSYAIKYFLSKTLQERG